MSKKVHQVFLDFMIGAKPAGRVIFDLYTDTNPKTAENFRGLCTGDYGRIGLGATTKKLHYLNNKMHKIVKGEYIAGGDITKGDGSGGWSIYGEKFADENFMRQHASAGLLCMQNKGRNGNNSQFYVTLKACPHLNGKNIVFGQVCNGMEVIRKLAEVLTDQNDRPKIPIEIVNCGEVDDPRSFLRFDPFKKEVFEELKEGREKQFQEIKDHINEEKAKEQATQNKDDMKQSSEALTQNDIFTTPQMELKIPAKKKVKYNSRLQDLKLKINEANNLNINAIIQEQQASEEGYKQNQNRLKQIEKKKDKEKEFETKGIDIKKSYLDSTAMKSEIQQKKQNKKKFHNVGNILTHDTLYQTYKNKFKGLKFYEDIYKEQQENPDQEYQPNEHIIQNLANEVEKQQLKRLKFSRERTDLGSDKNINSINDKNKVYNDKLTRHYGALVQEIKSNIEKGTA